MTWFLMIPAKSLILLRLTPILIGYHTTYLSKSFEKRGIYGKNTGS
jgi:hypothetical protein